MNEKVSRHVSRLRKMEVVKTRMSYARYTSTNMLVCFDKSWNPKFKNIYEGVRMGIYFYSQAPSFGRVNNQIKNTSIKTGRSDLRAISKTNELLNIRESSDSLYDWWRVSSTQTI